MRLCIVKKDGESVIMDDVNIVHVSKYLSVAERSDNIQFWSDPIQHEKVSHRIEIVFKK